jgi:hypothetical protein
MYTHAQLTPEARPIVEAAVEIYLRHMQPWFVGLVLHGSALKSGFIPWCSDIDLLLFLNPKDFAIPTGLPLETYLALRHDPSFLDLTPFRSIQCRAFATFPEGHTGLVPGAYHVLAGNIPVAEATREELSFSARKAFAYLIPLPPSLIVSLLEQGKGHLAWTIRWLCTGVWPTLYQLLILQGHDPFAVWRLPKPQALTLLPVDVPPGQAIRAFYQAVLTYYPAEQSTEDGLRVIATGVTFLQAAHRWWQEHKRDRVPTCVLTGKPEMRGVGQRTQPLGIRLRLLKPIADLLDPLIKRVQSQMWPLLFAQFLAIDMPLASVLDCNTAVPIRSS